MDFYPRPPRGGRRRHVGDGRALGAFLSTPSARRATIVPFRVYNKGVNFYPSPPRGGRRRSCWRHRTDQRFLSTPSARRATYAFRRSCCSLTISIHALREEGDRMTELKDSRFTISIHALREEGDIGSGEVLAPTPNFYPRPPRGGRPRGSRRNNKMGDFYPRPPRGGRRSAVRPGHRQRRISIHALREEGDITATSATDCGLNFYPRPPRGGRRDPEFKNIQRSLFLSTPSARRATEFAAQIFVGCRNFYPRPPRGGRPAVAGHRPLDERISIHALREEGDATGCLCVSVSHNFYPRPPRGGRLLEFG